MSVPKGLMLAVTIFWMMSVVVLVAISLYSGWQAIDGHNANGWVVKGKQVNRGEYAAAVILSTACGAVAFPTFVYLLIIGILFLVNSATSGDKPHRRNASGGSNDGG